MLMRIIQRIPRPTTIHPLFVGPLELVQIRHNRGGAGRHFGGESVRIALVDGVTVLIDAKLVTLRPRSDRE